ncbi:hypothetical protein TELCIR_08734, partial [Teladorsagia circumcincta]
VNWTEYLLLVSPPQIHDYILGNPQVAVPSTEYMKRVNQVLSKNSPKTLTNYVMVQYILSWLPLLEKKYNDLVQWFASSVDSTTPRNRSEVCFSETMKHYTVAMTAMYARSRSKKVLRPLMEEMVIGIIKGLRDEIQENEWMSSKFKEAVIGKVDKITWSLLDDSLFYNNTALDLEYSSHFAVKDLPFLNMLERIFLIENTENFMKLRKPFQVKEELKKFAVMAVPLPFMAFPIYDKSFPRSFLYGSVGHVIAHEISHSLDSMGKDFDGNGDKRKWWENEWVEEYDERAECYVSQYDSVKIPKFNMSLEGGRTLAENTADNEGLKLAYR